MFSDDTLFISVMRQSKLCLRETDTQPPDFSERAELKDT